MARGMEHGLVEAVTFVTLANHLTKSDSNKSAVAKMALVLSLAVIPTNTIIFFELSNPLWRNSPRLTHGSVVTLTIKSAVVQLRLQPYGWIMGVVFIKGCYWGVTAVDSIRCKHGVCIGMNPIPLQRLYSSLQQNTANYKDKQDKSWLPRQIDLWI